MITTSVILGHRNGNAKCGGTAITGLFATLTIQRLRFYVVNDGVEAKEQIVA